MCKWGDIWFSTDGGFCRKDNAVCRLFLTVIIQSLHEFLWHQETKMCIYRLGLCFCCYLGKKKKKKGKKKITKRFGFWCRGNHISTSAQLIYSRDTCLPLHTRITVKSRFLLQGRKVMTIRGSFLEAPLNNKLMWLIIHLIKYLNVGLFFHTNKHPFHSSPCQTSSCFCSTWRS